MEFSGDPRGRVASSSFLVGCRCLLAWRALLSARRVAEPGKRVSSRHVTHEASESQSATTMTPSSVEPAEW